MRDPTIFSVSARVHVRGASGETKFAELHHDSSLVWGHPHYTRDLLFQGSDEHWRAVAPKAPRGREVVDRDNPRSCGRPSGSRGETRTTTTTTTNRAA